MRHQKKTIKLGRTAEHRKALLANQVCSLIEHQRIRTTLAKAKAVRPLAEKMVTLGKKNPRKRRLQPERRDLLCALSGHFVCQVLLRCSCRRHRRQNIQLIQILPPETAAATTSLLRVGTRQRASLH